MTSQLASFTLQGDPLPDDVITARYEAVEAISEPYSIEVIHPDTFLLDLLDLAPGAVVDELSRQAAANRRAPRTLSQMLDALERGGVPAFADEVRRRTARSG